MLLTEKTESDSLLVNLLMNLGVLVLPFAFAVWYPQAGILASLLGSLTTLFTVYFIPVSTYLFLKHSEMTNPALAAYLRDEKVSDRSSSHSSATGSEEHNIYSSVLPRKNKEDETLTDSLACWFRLSVVLGIVSCTYGITVIIMQFL